MPTSAPANTRNERQTASDSGDDLGLDLAAVQDALDDLLASTPFCHTEQCKNLLRYIVKHTLAGEEHLLRERVIGANVFGRQPDYETGEDPVVRIRAADVRKRLAQYYQNLPVAGSNTIHIDIPSGSYRAVIQQRKPPGTALASFSVAVGAPNVSPASEPTPVPDIVPTAAAPEIVPAATTGQSQAAPRTRRSYRVWLAFSVLLLALAGLVVKLTPSPETRDFERFWKPWTHQDKPIILAIGSNAVYRLSDSFVDSYARDQKLQSHGMEFFVPTGPDTRIKGTDVIPAYNSFVALGDVAAVSEIVANTTRMGQTLEERFPNDISFAELRSTPTVLVGGFNNPMNMELTRKLPFVLLARNEIAETRPGGRRWILNASGNSEDTEDYAIVTRMAQRGEDAPILSIAGIGQYGTLAAAGFICDPSAIHSLAWQLGSGWESRNVQVVLHVKVVDFKAAPPEIVGYREW